MSQARDHCFPRPSGKRVSGDIISYSTKEIMSEEEERNCLAAFNRQPNVLFLLPQSHASPVNRPQRYGKWRFTVRHAIPLPSGALLSVLFHESARGKWAPSAELC